MKVTIINKTDYLQFANLQNSENPHDTISIGPKEKVDVEIKNYKVLEKLQEKNVFVIKKG